MKVLISDYSNTYTTEPYYINTVLNTIGCESSLWPTKISTYDIFDKVQPDLHITHYKLLSQDLIFYMKENKGIDIIINISGIDQETLKKMESILSESNIKPTFFFINHQHNLYSRKNNINTILHGADLFLSYEPQKYNIDYALFVNKKTEIKPLGETYHYISCNPELREECDIFLPVERLNHLYHNYNNIVIKYFDNVFTQLFFDASLRMPTFFDISDRSDLDKNLIKLLGKDNCCRLNNPESGDIKNIIKSKHTCLNRVKSILSQLSCGDYLNKIEDLIERSIK